MPDAKTIISLTSIPARFAHLGPTLESLLAQDLPASEIVLYIPRCYQRFADWDGTLPPVPAGVTLRRCDQDYGPATKLLPALKEFQGQDVDILFCDDDLIYPPGWHGAFRAARLAHPEACIAGSAADHLWSRLMRPRAHQPRLRRWHEAALKRHMARNPQISPLAPPQVRRSGFGDLLEGWAGAMVKPAFFTDMVFEIPREFRMVDDPWISGNLAVNGVPIWSPAEMPPPIRRHDIGAIEGLIFLVDQGKGRSELDRSVTSFFRSHHGVWRRPRLHDTAHRLLPQAVREAILTSLRNLRDRLGG